MHSPGLAQCWCLHFWVVRWLQGLHHSPACQAWFLGLVKTGGFAGHENKSSPWSIPRRDAIIRGVHHPQQDCHEHRSPGEAAVPGRFAMGTGPLVLAPQYRAGVLRNADTIWILQHIFLTEHELVCCQEWGSCWVGTCWGPAAQVTWLRASAHSLPQARVPLGGGGGDARRDVHWRRGEALGGLHRRRESDPCRPGDGWGLPWWHLVCGDMARPSLTAISRLPPPYKKGIGKQSLFYLFIFFPCRKKNPNREAADAEDHLLLLWWERLRRDVRDVCLRRAGRGHPCQGAPCRKDFQGDGFWFFYLFFLNQTCQASQLLYLRVCIAYSVIYCKEELGVTPISYYNFVSFRNSSPLNLSFQLCQDI